MLRARFADAQFFWETDQKKQLGDYLPKLKAVTYESRLGSYGDKVERMRALARWLAEQWFSGGVSQADVAGSDRAAELAKCDLVTEMVREFTELQGVVGGLYARAQGESDEIAWAVYDHYKPSGAGRSAAAEFDGMRGGAGGQAGFAGGVFRGGRGADGFERSFCVASRGAGNREDYSRAKAADVAFGGDFGCGESAARSTRRGLRRRRRCRSR